MTLATEGQAIQGAVQTGGEASRYLINATVRTIDIPLSYQEHRICITSKLIEGGFIHMNSYRVMLSFVSLAIVSSFTGVSAFAAEKTLCQKYGAALPKVVDDFVAKAAPDPAVDFFRGGKFKNVNVPKLKMHLVNFISDAIGCTPKKYKGRTMKAAHKGMAITSAQFGAIAADLQSTLETDGVTPEDVKTIMGVVGGTAKDIIEVK
jgi:truncated hemoglobin YjbI